MTRLGAVAIVIGTLVIDLRHRYVEHAFGAVDLLGNLRQVGDRERRSVLFAEFHERNIVEIQLEILYRELVLREVERLLDQVDVLVFHKALRMVVRRSGFATLQISEQSSSRGFLRVCGCKVGEYFSIVQHFARLF